jgi:putative ABC transport system permease protein
MLLKNRAFTLTALFILALGIGANSAIFSVINAVLLRPLPYKDSERIVYVWGKNQKDSNDRSTVSLPDYQDWKGQGRSFEAMGAYALRAYNLSGEQRPEAVQGAMVSSGFLESIGVEPAMGRRFRPEEEHQNLVILGHDLWRSRYGSNPGILGQSVTLSSGSYTVIGVMPPGFNFPRKDVEVWTSFSILRNVPVFQSRGARVLHLIGRLKSGVSVSQAQAEMNVVAGRLEQQYQDTNTGIGVNLVPIREQVFGNISLTLFFVWAAVGLVLLIVCANLASLLMARNATRETEFAIRTALGATRMRLIRQLLTESVALSVIGGVLGLLLAILGVDMLVKLSPANLPRLDDVGLDIRWALFTFALSLLTGVIFGLAPALQASRRNIATTLKEGGRGTVGAWRQRRLRGLVVTSEIAVALVLLVGANLMINSFIRLNTIDPGFDPKNVLTMYIAYAKEKYQQPQQELAYLDRLLQQLRQAPGMQDVALGLSLPPNGLYSRESFSVEGRTEGDSASAPSADYLPVSDRYFRTIKAPLLRGREFTEADKADSPRVAIINKNLADRYFANDDPIGKRVIMGDTSSENSKYTIVGVVGDVKYEGLSEKAHPQLYFPYTQHPTGGAYFIMRTSSAPQGMFETVRKTVFSVDNEQPVRLLRTMDELISEAVAQPRFSMVLLSIFAAVALALTSIGLYGLIAYSVTQRTHEIGLRLALGAGRRDVIMLILKQGVKLSMIGAAVGLIAAFASTRMISNLLYGVSATDPVIFLSAALALVTVAILACLIPAGRAGKVEPSVALREE